MKIKINYTINYTSEGKILGFVKGDTDLNIEVSNQIWFEAQSFNKILIDGDNISFEKVNWRTTEEIEAENIAEAKRVRNKAMLDGTLYNIDGTPYKVSFTKNDGDGLMQVKSAFEMGLSTTIIHFENGTMMPISSSKFQAFALWFVNKRNEFFIT